MNSNSDGLSPSLKPFLGVGHNRALPAAFGFDNGWQGDGVNDYFTIPRLIGKIIPNDLTFEVFFKNNQAQNMFFQIGAAINTVGFNMGSTGNGSIQVGTDHNTTGYGYSSCGLLTGTLMHVVCALSRSLDRSLKHGMFRNGGAGSGDVVNGIDATPVGTINTIGTDGLYGDQITISRAVFGVGAYGYNSNLYYSKDKWDEFRMYKKCLTKAQAARHWNNGAGDNPSNTEDLIFWFKFQEFEMLDFSMLQDGSDIKLGLRDYSGNNFHALPQNMDTNPASPNYVLKPF